MGLLRRTVARRVSSVAGCLPAWWGALLFAR